MAVAHEEEFSLAVARKVRNGFWGQFCRSNTFTQIGFNIVLMKRLYEKPNTSLSHDMERRKVNGYKLLY